MYRLIFRCNFSAPVPTTRSVSFHTQKWVPLMSCGSVCYHCEDHSWDLFPAFSNHLYRTYFASVRDLYLFTFLFYGKSFFETTNFLTAELHFLFVLQLLRILGWFRLQDLSVTFSSVSPLSVYTIAHVLQIARWQFVQC